MMRNKLSPETIIITGTSRLPENVTSHHVYGYFSIDIEIEKETDKVVDFACTLIPRLVEKIISDTLVGYPFAEGVVNTLEKLNERFFSSTKKAILAALDDANKWFLLYKKAVLQNEVERKKIDREK